MFKNKIDSEAREAVTELARRLGYGVTFFKYFSPSVTQYFRGEYSSVSLKDYIFLNNKINALLDYLNLEYKTEGTVKKIEKK